MLAIAGLAACVVFAAIVAWGVYAATSGSLRSLLDGVVNRSAATQFYSRAFLICIVFSAFSGALSNKWDPSAGAPMERVWSAASAVSSILNYVLLTLLAFAVVFSILVAALGRRGAEAPVCLKCGYSLKGLIDDLRCPECGEHLAGTHKK